jgi:hypothetical protein
MKSEKYWASFHLAQPTRADKLKVRRCNMPKNSEFAQMQGAGENFAAQHIGYM